MPLQDLIAAQSKAEKRLRQQAPPRGFIASAHPGWQPQRDLLLHLLDAAVPGHTPGHLRFLVHLLASSPEEEFVPVSYKLLRTLDPSRSPSSRRVWAPLVEAGLVERRPHVEAKRRSAQYRLPPPLLDALAAATPATVGSAADAVDVVSGRRARAAQSAAHDRNRKPYPPLVVGGLRAIPEGRFHAPAVEAHLADLAERAALARADAGADPSSEEAERAAASAEARLRTDRFAYSAVLLQRPRPAGAPGVYAYRAAYAVATTGRVVQFRGGLQGASRRMKAAAYAGVPGALNYDLQACHVNVLIELLERAGIGAGWFAAFADDPGERGRLAAAAGLPEDAFKSAVYALVNGAALPRDPARRWGDRPEGEVVALVRAATGAGFPEAWGRLRGVLAPALDPLRAWHAHLLGPYAAEHAGKGRGGAFVTNRAGMRFYPHHYGERERGRKLAAFVLQGFESALVHTLAALGPAHGYAPIANEHDGLVTLGAVPAAAVKEAKARVGLVRGRLVVKPLCSPEDLADLERACELRGVPLHALPGRG